MPLRDDHGANAKATVPKSNPPQTCCYPLARTCTVPATAIKSYAKYANEDIKTMRISARSWHQGTREVEALLQARLPDLH